MMAFESPIAESGGYTRQKAKDLAKKFIPGELCTVCGDVASGIHYSVAACNGCKTFFRRVVLENRTYSCKNNGDCIIDKSMRCSCRHCRYKKCIVAGMDRAELSMERRRKRKKLNGLEGSEERWETEDPLINLLLFKETLYQKLLHSSAMSIHTSLIEALDMTQIAFNDKNNKYDDRMDPKYPTNFSYWRAKILTVLVEWAKSFEVFSNLSKDDQKRLYIHTAFSNLVLAEAFHTPEKYNDRIVFPDGLCGFRNVAQSVSSDGVGMTNKTSGLTPTVVAVINDVLVPIRRMRLTKVEYVLLQAIIFFDPDCLSLTPSATQIVAAKRRRLLDSLQRWLQQQTRDAIEASTRFAEILLRICNVQKVAAFKRETLCTIETFDLMQPHPFTMEISKCYPEMSYF